MSITFFYYCGGCKITFLFVVGELMVLVEFCSKGSLESYLVKNRHSFENIVKHGRLEWTNKIQEDRLDYSVYDLVFFCRTIYLCLSLKSNIHTSF